jgi:spermidine synthase
VAAAPVLLALFFASGFAGLVYELLWVRALALVFGNTAQATATTLAVFFLGASLGQLAAGRIAARARNPLRLYAALEILVAATAAAYFAILPVYRATFPPLLARLGSDSLILTAACAVLAAGAMAPLTFFMGATLPVMGHLLVRRADELAPTFGLLYAVQTVGGALGAFTAGFWLPGSVGFTRTYLLAMAVSTSIAGLAFLVGRTAEARSATAAPADAGSRQLQPHIGGAHALASVIACLSGFATLSIEVLWTQMFAQVLHNSVYSFSAILVTFLVSLGLGGLLARAVARIRSGRPLAALVVLLVLSGVAVAFSAFAFDWMTDGRSALEGAGWGGYVRALFVCAAAVMLGPGIILGSVFPYTLRLARRAERGAAIVIGELAAWNTVGAVAGSLYAGFVSLPWLGLWASLRAIALLYLLGAAIAAGAGGRALRALALAPIVAAVLLFTGLDPTRLTRVALAPGEELKSVSESASGTVAVTETDGVRFLTLNRHYIVGGNGSVDSDRRQAELPMLLHPQPRSLFFLGLGTGATAGAALFHPVERVTVAEIIPGVVQAARDSFAPLTNGLFSDARARIEIGDARTVLLADPQHYDVIVGDLFVPWQAGTGSLYTREHFASVRDRLTDDGLFAQWLPLYQMSWREFSVIARTMLEVFPLVTVWRGDFSGPEPVVALVGQRSARPLDLDAVVANVRRRQGGEGYPAPRARALALLFYAGNMTAARALVDAAPINTDDRPVIEYLAPATPMEVAAGREEWLTGLALSRLWAQLAAVVPPADDPYLAAVPADERDGAYAGRMLHDASILQRAGHAAEARAAYEEFRSRVPADVAAAFPAP